MKTVPKGGQWIDVLCRSKHGVDLVVKKLRYQNSRSRGNELRGEQNLLSPYLKPRKWDDHRADVR